MIFPAWFKNEIGFRFLDGDGDECVFLGRAGYRKYEMKLAQVMVGNDSIGSFAAWPMEMIRDRDVYAFKYKNEWHLGDIQSALLNNPDWLENCKPVEGQENTENWHEIMQNLSKKCDKSNEPFNQRIFVMEVLAKELAEQCELDLEGKSLDKLIEHYGEHAGRAIHSLIKED